MRDPSDEIDITRAELDNATREFNAVYGETLAEWSRLEGQLFYWFRFITSMNEKLARAIFYSARNFTARADMLSAAMRAGNLEATVLGFLKETLKKIRMYDEFRNRATHGEAHINLQEGSPSAKQMVIIQGREVSEQAESGMVTMLDLMTATNNFKRLRAYLFEGHPDQEPPLSLLETYQQRVRELPNQAQSIEPNRKS